jgi:hypothetical protein
MHGFGSQSLFSEAVNEAQAPPFAPEGGDSEVEEEHEV